MLTASASAETVFLKNGRSLNGRITYKDSDQTRIELYMGGEMILKNEEIASIDTSQEKTENVKNQASGKPARPTATPAPDEIIVLDSVMKATPTPTPTATPRPTPTPLQLRPIKFRRVDKQEHRTLLARRFVYHIVVEEKIENWETRALLIQLMRMCLLDAKYADGIEVRLYGLDSKGKIYEWPFAVADYAPEGNWDKAQANIPKDRYLLKVKIQDEIEYYKL